METWKIEITGNGPHHTGDASDALQIGEELVRTLIVNGHSVTGATFVVTDESGEEMVSTTTMGQVGFALRDVAGNVLQFFEYAHLPPPLRAVSAMFAELARKVYRLPVNPESRKALDKLVEAKDAAVRAKLYK